MLEKFKNKFKRNDGFTGQDILLALFMLVLFLSLFTTLTVNISKTSGEISKVKKLSDKITQVSEIVDSLTYDQISDTNIEEKQDITTLSGCENVQLENNMEIGYTINVQKEIEEGVSVKTVTLIAKYDDIAPITINISKRLQSTVINLPSGSLDDNGVQVVVYNRNAQYPFNRPQAEDDSRGALYYGGDAKLVPIKPVWKTITKNSLEVEYVVTTYDDLEWYSIEENNFPRFAYEQSTRRTYDNTRIRYNLFKSSANSKNNYVDNYGFIWIPKFLVNNSRNDSYNYYYASEDSNYTYRLSETLGYVINTNQYYPTSNNSIAELPYTGQYRTYTRGFLLGWRAATYSKHWDEIYYGSSYYYYIPTYLREKIDSLDRFVNEYPTK